MNLKDITKPVGTIAHAKLPFWQSFGPNFGQLLPTCFDNSCHKIFNIWICDADVEKAGSPEFNCVFAGFERRIYWLKEFNLTPLAVPICAFFTCLSLSPIISLGCPPSGPSDQRNHDFSSTFKGRPSTISTGSEIGSDCLFGNQLSCRKSLVFCAAKHCENMHKKVEYLREGLGGLALFEMARIKVAWCFLHSVDWVNIFALSAAAISSALDQ